MVFFLKEMRIKYNYIRKIYFSVYCNLEVLFLKDNVLILFHLIHFFPFYFNISFFFHNFAWKYQKLKNYK